MPKQPLISFYIPVYKKPPEVFRNCLKSLFDMSFKEIEVIAVFDGVDLDLQTVAEEFKKVKIVVIPHGGAPKARNAGLQIAKGTYVVAWDADCLAKPEMAKRWMQEFEAVPDADFVYTGYEISKERGGFDSESFDAYSLTCGNYISSMSPIKREKAPQWDESLKAAQDWDYWLTAVENGCKGVWIPGPGFIADSPEEGISAKHWTQETRGETMRIVREKHGIPEREIGVYSVRYYDRAVKIAKILDADVIKSTGRSPEEYKMLINLGHGNISASRFDGISKETVKIQFWFPLEVEALAEAKYTSVTEMARISKEVKSFCGTIYEQKKLESFGIEADVLPLALAEEDLAKAETKLPDQHSVLVLVDENYAKLLKELEVDLPHITFGWNQGKVKDFSCVVSFYQFATLDEAILIAHINGRNVISNIQAPYCGFIDPTQTWESFKKELYYKIREYKTKPFNEEAKALYLDLVDPKKFKEELTALKPFELVIV